MLSIHLSHLLIFVLNVLFTIVVAFHVRNKLRERFDRELALLRGANNTRFTGLDQKVMLLEGTKLTHHQRIERLEAIGHFHHAEGPDTNVVDAGFDASDFDVPADNPSTQMVTSHAPTSQDGRHYDDVEGTYIGPVSRQSQG